MTRQREELTARGGIWLAIFAANPVIGASYLAPLVQLGFSPTLTGAVLGAMGGLLGFALFQATRNLSLIVQLVIIMVLALVIYFAYQALL